ncbi:prepilin peptidase [Calidifontibacillus erzurumensis]|uniref:prepilin peptidase n=1 Tax=Calidifontibacillus erzurumensis TaxID=2741433 RepID=UPI0035B5089D
MNTIAYIVLAVISIVAVYTDIKGFKIRNILTIPSALIALIISVFYFDNPFFGFENLVVLLLIGLLGEWMKLWKAGDTKLMVATGMWLSLTNSMENLALSFLYFLTFVLLHLAIGHFYGLKKYRFSLKNYIYSILFNKNNESYGRFRGAITISISLIIVIGLKFAVQVT